MTSSDVAQSSGVCDHHPMIELTSTSNTRVKGWFALGKRSVRDATRTFLVEGGREVERIQQHADVLEVIWCSHYAGDDTPAGATTVSAHIFDRLSHRQHPDGVAAVVRTPNLSLDRLDTGKDPLVLIADGIEKPGNIGAMLRTCDALGASFIGSSLGTDLVNPNVIRSAQGSLFGTPTAVAPRTEVVGWATQHTRTIVLRPDDADGLWDMDLTGAVSVVIGAEDVGVAPEWNGVGRGVRIPMRGTADSLNASVTAAIVLAEALRQRSG